MPDNSPYTQSDIDALVAAYAAHHDVEPSAVDVSRNTSDNTVIGVRLSLDIDGRSRGCDETFGEWR
jgi:hypothetical protein